MIEFNVNWWAVLVGAAINMVIGALWYSPALFAKPWMKLIGKTEKQLAAQANTGYLVAAIAALAESFLLANVVMVFGATTAWNGAVLGAVVWACFVAATTLTQSYFSNEPKKLWAINSTYYLAVFIINGALLAVWR